MSRIHYWQTITNNEGQPVAQASVYIYLAGTNTQAYIYKDEINEDYTNGNGNPQVTTDSNGKFEFWVGDLSESHGYDNSQKFRIQWSHPTINPGAIEYEDIFPLTFPVDENDDLDEVRSKCLSNKLAFKWDQHVQDIPLNPHPKYLKKDGTTELTNDWDVGNFKILTHKIQGKDIRGISIFNSSGKGIVIDEDNVTTLSNIKIESDLFLSGVKIIATPEELNSLAGKVIGSNINGAIVTTTDIQTLYSKFLFKPKFNSNTELVATSEELNQLHGVNIADIIAGSALANQRLDSPKINEEVSCFITSTELNILHGKTIGGNGVLDIVDISSTQTLSNKKVTNFKINDDVIVTVTGNELNKIHGKTVVDTESVQTLSFKVLTTPTILDFSGASHNHSSASTGGSISHASLTNLTADDHTQYSKKASTETISGIWSFSNPINGATPITSSHLAPKGYVDNKVKEVIGSNNFFPLPGFADQLDVTNVNSLAEIISRIGVSRATIVFYGGDYTLAGTNAAELKSLVIPANITLLFYNGAKLIIANGITLTINGKIITENQQIFTINGTGVVNGTPIIQKINPIWFGFKNSNSAVENGTCLKNTINFITTNSTIEFTPDNYQITGPITINKSLFFKGNNTFLIEQSTSNNTFVVETDDKVIFDNLNVNGKSDVLRTAIAVLIGNSVENNNSIFNNCNFKYHGTALHFKNAAKWNVSNCSFVDNHEYGVYIENISDYTKGDSTIFNSYFDTTYNSISGIFYTSGGNIRIINNIFKNFQYGFLTNFNTSTTGIANLILNGNIFEDNTVGCIRIQEMTSPEFIKINISNNELVSKADGIIIESNVNTIIISNNNIKLSNNDTSAILLNSGTNILINGNILNGSALTETTGINNVGGTNISQNINMFMNFTTTVKGTFI